MIEANRAFSFARSHLNVRAGPSGIHMFNRTTGLNVLLDEIRVPQALWAGAPRQVSIALTNACDLACAHCFVPKNPTMLHFERVTDWLNELDENGCLGIGLGGGEPTLYPRLVDLCQYAARHTKLAITLTTHAHLLDEEFAAALNGSVNFVRVSMDGVGATYEAIRRRPFVAFCRRLENIRSVAPFGINYVVNARTLPDLDTATMLAAELGAAEFLLLPEQPVHGNGGIDGHTAQALRHWVTQYRGSVPLTVSEVAAEGLPTCNPLPCETGLYAYAHIDAAGVLKRSSYEYDGMAIGADGIMQALKMLRSNQEEER